MGGLDTLFGKKEEGQKDDTILEELEEAVFEGDLFRAVQLADGIKKDGNLFLALRLILSRVNELEDDSKMDKSKLTALLREIIPRVNSINSERYRALLFGDLAVAFYHIGDEFSADFALKTALNLASGHPDVIRDILKRLVDEGLLPKASYALRMVKDRKTLDLILAYIAERLYLEGKKKNALVVVENIASPFHRAIALHNIALLEKDKEVALKLIGRAIEEAGKIKDPEARFELMIKLHDTMYRIKGEPPSIESILRASSPDNGRYEHEDADYEHQG